MNKVAKGGHKMSPLLSSYEQLKKIQRTLVVFVFFIQSRLPHLMFTLAKSTQFFTLLSFVAWVIFQILKVVDDSFIILLALNNHPSLSANLLKPKGSLYLSLFLIRIILVRTRKLTLTHAHTRNLILACLLIIYF